MHDDLNDIITDSLSDAELPLEDPGVEAATTDDPTQVEEPVTTDTDPTEVKEEAAPAETDSPEVQSPASKPQGGKQDDFEKRFGIPANSVTGRENRIPHSRVRQMVAKADKETEARVRAELSPKVSEYETKVKDYETKVTDYEARLTQVAQFEQVLAKDPVTFLTMLYGQPQYQAYLRPLFEQTAQPQTPTPPAQEQSPVPDDMPQPDQTLSDGSKVYSMEGLTKLNTWNRTQAAAQARKEALEEVNKKFGGMYQEWEQHQRVQSYLPKVQAQIEEARKWPQFTENEAAIVKALQANSNLSLEGAYRQVVIPHLTQAQTAAQTDRTELEKQIRAQVLEEIKKTPRSTSAPSRATAPAAPRTTGNRSLESIIEESIRAAK